MFKCKFHTALHCILVCNISDISAERQIQIYYSTYMLEFGIFLFAGDSYALCIPLSQWRYYEVIGFRVSSTGFCIYYVNSFQKGKQLLNCWLFVSTLTLSKMLTRVSYAWLKRGIPESGMAFPPHPLIKSSATNNTNKKFSLYIAHSFWDVIATKCYLH